MCVFVCVCVCACVCVCVCLYCAHFIRASELAAGWKAAARVCGFCSDYVSIMFINFILVEVFYAYPVSLSGGMGFMYDHMIFIFGSLVFPAYRFICLPLLNSKASAPSSSEILGSIRERAGGKV